MSTPDKRMSYEAAGKLLEPTGYNPRMPRPAAIVAGAALVLARAIIGTLAGLGTFGAWDGTLRNAGTVVDMLVAVLSDLFGSVTVAVIAVGLTGLAISVGLFLGWNAVRVLVMVAAVVDICVSFASWLAHGGAFELFGDKTAVAVDILVLLALSSRSAAAYARRNEHRDAR
ncbi:MAG: hypothetical protein ABS62_10675 [Microbacterium sp. SCN 70-200]|uniref:hypothetical protein n=1 Tax=unclassified Microbacterium TaxID=2609290 RepID=UPI00086A4608|nr:MULTISPECIES: hypothetical protein [unclassified Microbacterium]MBN9216040.1 hypothetical protein [Microbacterium sp.]ODT40326.1 MAG: hypothetical protein ABS62_10675 [Microbacterium sp. SCN 70-200]OJV82041.1 MAG: hypothetical protein BGO46_05880 [Microbacterium sp. 70-16]